MKNEKHDDCSDVETIASALNFANLDNNKKKGQFFCKTKLI